MRISPHQSNGLYDPSFEHDACGVAFIADIEGRPSHDIIQDGLTALLNMEHRGASGSEPDSGDGAGILIQNPDSFWRQIVSFPLPPVGHYLTGIAFLDSESAGPARQAQLRAIDEIAAEEDLYVIGTREIPVDSGLLGATSRATEPYMLQYF
ncbi:MAG: hypothetical protein ACP5PJ_09755, partial [Acidimicrobiales bacterium]